MSNESRKDAILDAAAKIFAESGVRASLKTIADACGILPGSLYHHFDSKEAIIVELLERFHEDLARIAAEALDGESGEQEPDEAIITLSTAIAHCAIRHRAALLLSYFEPPASARPELREATGRTPLPIQSAMSRTLRSAQDRGYIRANLDAEMLADRVCQSMLHVGIGVYHRTRDGRRVPELKCRIILDGLAVDPRDGEFSTDSAAHRTAERFIEEWEATESEPAGREALIRRAARSEFAKRGFDATTMRDVAAAAGLGSAALYRVFDSKEELLGTIMRSYASSVANGWNQVMRTAASPIEKLDSLLWFAINVLDRFHEEHRIQALSLQQAPPSTVQLSLSFPAMLKQVRLLLAAGDDAGQFKLADWPTDLRARSVFSLLWTPENIVHELGTKGARELARDTVLRGIALPISHVRR
ncbi:TetR/AcrR family transcriptional regulator [Pseudofrankia saprophytica]|uniref:TetR/AcrR family transcriptional regulator n=1 Tax=Pseudofrankia saprophytica TaxID=298655 RepID=UPI000234CA58|nr:TetR/AcrR family transcriptional regulator [Pseudofrankia saprophytica]